MVMKRSLEADTSSSPPLALSGRVLLVTGAGGGIGRACCQIFVARGAKVVCADVCKDAATATAKLACEARPDGAAAEAMCADVTSEQECKRMVSFAVSKFGRLDGALNAAGMEGERSPLHETSMATFDKVMDVNLRGTFLSMKAEIEQMLKQPMPAASAIAGAASKKAQAGSSTMAAIDERNYCIVNVSSTAGQGAMPEFSCYSASKFAILGLTRTAAREYASAGIRVNAVCPSTTDTPMVARFTERWPEWQAKQNVRARGRL